jgi:translation initiation factor 1
MPRRAPPRHDKRTDVDGGAATRLVYSTGGGTPPVAKPADPRLPATPPRGAGGVRLRIERRASDRVVTIVAGLPGTAAQIEALARELRALCGAGGTARDGQVELQGDQREKAAAALEARGLRVRR